MVTIEWSEEDEAYIARDLDMPGCCSHGDTEFLALDQLGDARIAWLRAKLALTQSGGGE